MTDKTDALVALADDYDKGKLHPDQLAQAIRALARAEQPAERREGLTDRALMAAWRAMADVLEADPDIEDGAAQARRLRGCANELQSREELFGTSAPQPAGDAVKCPTCGAPTVRTEKEGAYDMHYEYTYTAPPAASVDVKELARKWRKEARELRDYGSEYRCNIANAKAYMLELCVEELRPLIDAAGGAKGSGIDPGIRYMINDDGTLTPTTPQPDGGNGAVFGYVYQLADEEPSFEFAANRWPSRGGNHTETAVYARPSAAAAVPDAERVAQLTAHRVCHSAEHDPENGRLHGYCIVCGVPWPCEIAAAPAAPKGVDVSDAVVARSADALVLGWNLHYPDAVRMAKCALSAATQRAEQEEHS